MTWYSRRSSLHQAAVGVKNTSASNDDEANNKSQEKSVRAIHASNDDRHKNKHKHNDDANEDGDGSDLPEKAKVEVPSEILSNPLTKQRTTINNDPRPVYSPFSPHHDLYGTLSTVATTLAACAAAAAITHPAEQSRLRWEQSTLQQWRFLTSTAQKRPNRILTPFVRVWTNQVATTAIGNVIIAPSTTTTTTLQSQLETQVVAGTLAGAVQVALLTPLQIFQTYRTSHHELQQQAQSSWKYWLGVHLFQGGSWDPIERRQRIVSSIGLQSTREIIFNVTFFPIFSLLQRQLIIQGHSNSECDCEDGRDIHDNVPTWSTLLLSGLGAGMFSSLAVTPMDLAQTYFRHSRQQWHWWKGSYVHAPPLQLLGKGLLLQ